MKIAPSRELRDNNFDFLRFLFASIVFFVHAYVLSGEQELAALNRWLSSGLAVQSFFVVSGFLIFMSFEHSSSPERYFEKRARRIYPAYVAVILLAVVVGAMLTTVGWEDYFSVQTVKYLVSNLLFLNFLQSDLPGLFTDNRMQTVNGALWTLKIEVMFYFSVPLLVWLMRRWGRWQVLLLSYVSSMLYVYLLGYWGEHGGLEIYRELQRQLPGQLSWFIAGGALFYYIDVFRRWWRELLAMAVAVFFFQQQPLFMWLEPAALAIMVIYVACLFPYLGKFGKYGDFSYGIYIVHFPVLQALIDAGLFSWSPVVGVIMAAMIVLLMAFSFWHGIEKPFLRRSSHYVEVVHES